MPPRSLRFHPEAIDEAAAAADWYAAKAGEGIAANLELELKRAFDLIAEAPLRCPEHSRGTRRYLLRRFPFSIIYRVLPSSIQVIAVAHARRRPGYWRKR